MRGKVEIINLALARLGESPIQSLGEDSVPARAANLLYDSSRQAALRDFNWNFALKIERLARFDGNPVDFRLTYALPPDCLRVIRLRGGVPFPFAGTDFTQMRKPLIWSTLRILQTRQCSTLNSLRLCHISSLLNLR